MSEPPPGEDMGVPIDALARALASVGSHLRSVSYSPDRIRAGVDSLPRPRDLLILQDLLVPSTRLALVLFDASGNTVETTLPGPGEERP